MQKITSFDQLIVWQEAYNLSVNVYKLSGVIIRKKDFGLADQMRRAAVSVPSNIAEGFGRVSRLEKIRFYYIAKGSLTELHCQLMICRDVGYLTVEDFLRIEERVVKIRQLIGGSLRSLS